MRITIAPAGTEIPVRGTEEFVRLNDGNCVWSHDGRIFFTREGWDSFLRRREYLPEFIDNMRF